MAFGRGRSPCAASAFGRVAELPRRAFCLLFAKSLPARGAKMENQSWPVAGELWEHRVGQISDLPCVNRFGEDRNDPVTCNTVLTATVARTDAARAGTRRRMSSSGS
jgi:hypothetical protein